MGPTREIQPSRELKKHCSRAPKAVFVFSGNAGICRCLFASKKWIFQKRISVDRKIKAFDPENIFSQNFTFKSFPETRKERKRERKDSRKQREREIANPES